MHVTLLQVEHAVQGLLYILSTTKSTIRSKNDWFQSHQETPWGKKRLFDIGFNRFVSLCNQTKWNGRKCFVFGWGGGCFPFCLLIGCGAFVYICIRNGEGEGEEEEELDTVEMDIHVYKRKLLVKRNAEPPLSPFCGDDGRTDGRTNLVMTAAAAASSNQGRPPKTTSKVYWWWCVRAPTQTLVYPAAILTISHRPSARREKRRRRKKSIPMIMIRLRSLDGWNLRAQELCVCVCVCAGAPPAIHIPGAI